MLSSNWQPWNRTGSAHHGSLGHPPTHAHTHSHALGHCNVWTRRGSPSPCTGYPACHASPLPCCSLPPLPQSNHGCVQSRDASRQKRFWSVLTIWPSFLLPLQQPGVWRGRLRGSPRLAAVGGQEEKTLLVTREAVWKGNKEQREASKWAWKEDQLWEGNGI